MPPTPLVLSPALPSELLTYIIHHQTHPTTLIICASRADFLESLRSQCDFAERTESPDPAADAAADDAAADAQAPHEPAANLLLHSPLYQVAVARHIRMVFVPTVAHLRAYLSVFTATDPKVPPPPRAAAQASTSPLLLAYGLLNLHRDTSEWSARGINSTAAALVEAARTSRFRAVLVEPPWHLAYEPDDDGGGGDDDDAEDTTSEARRLEPGADHFLLTEVPVLSAKSVRAANEVDESAWTGRRVSLRRVLGRWFRYKEGDWVKTSAEAT